MKPLTTRVAVRARLGATTVEYAVILALLAVVLIALVVPLGQQLKSSFGRANAAIADVNEPQTHASSDDTSAADASEASAAPAPAARRNGNGHGREGRGREGRGRRP